MKGSTVALIIALPVVLGGGGVGAYFLLRRKPVAVGQANLAALQATYGSKAVAECAPPGAGAPPAAGGGGGNFMGNIKGVGVNLAAGYLDKYIPGLGGAAKGVVGTVDKLAGKTLGKIPGVGSIGSKLGLW